jgi:hypothetical protein
MGGTGTGSPLLDGMSYDCYAQGTLRRQGVAEKILALLYDVALLLLISNAVFQHRRRIQQ